MGGTGATDGSIAGNEPTPAEGDSGKQPRARWAFGLVALFLLVLAVTAGASFLLTDAEELFTNQVVAVALLPALIFALVMGWIKSFKGFGLEVVMNEDIAAATTRLKSIVDESKTESIVEPSSGGARAVSFTVGRGPTAAAADPADTPDQGGRTADKDARRVLESVPDARYAVFEDAAGEFAGISSAGLIYTRDEFDGKVADGTILDDPAVSTRTIHEEATMIEALRTFERFGTDTLAVVDGDENLVGVVTREDVLSQVILAGYRSQA